ncbi:uncharacterized protein LOC110821464 isoform X1 [Carica papaya]|uniref:uncharacterized protein LOC110821464 isoform X1 n=1 Tax=Carica papaya TaxID=3649 RepID=UPI000B8CD0FC|nr:uncharacterized protein LOC110821464 isoform X1 [Carica papaya]XP_021907008.1 uncharacterized protein LOC110821464 isoform X1 [Carica papaya]XP_021907009.1 uncharacterized protein LOC110821464 isoform X1 [Carica papaya]
MEKSVFYKTDCESILSQIKHKEKQLKLKRRWLLGLPTSESGHKLVKRPNFLNYACLPESLLREDDIFYETVKAHVEEAFGVYDPEREVQVAQGSEEMFGRASTMKVLESCLDMLTNKGLYLIAIILTAGSVNFDKSRQKMKRLIKVSLSQEFRNRGHNREQKDIFRQLHQVLSDSRNFREGAATHLTPRIQSHHAAAIKALNELEDLPSQTLIAMRRKLSCVKSVPQLQSRKCSWNRAYLINQVKKHSEMMLSELAEGEELPEPLAKAMAIASISLKLSQQCQSRNAVDFYQFSPEIERLQNEIVKAIWLLKTKVRFSELKTLQLLLDPDADISNGCLRTAVKKMLIEYLFECSDMDSIPKSLFDVLAIVNRSSRSVSYRCFPKEEIEEEIECILRVSADTKQIIWDWLPDHDYDQDFSDAYMEELEESDDGGSIDDGDYSCDDNEDDNISQQSGIGEYQQKVSCSYDSDYEAESTAESLPVDSKIPLSTIGEKSSSSYVTPCARLAGVSTKGGLLQQFNRVESGPHRVSWSSAFKKSRILNSTDYMDTEEYEVKSVKDDGEEKNGGNRKSSLTSPASNFTSMKEESDPCKQTSRNQYLFFQEVCDETSMVAYNLIGRLMKTFVEEQGLDLDQKDSLYLGGEFVNQEDTPGTVEEENSTFSKENVSKSFIRVIEELMPSLSKRGIERLKELMGES